MTDYTPDYWYDRHIRMWTLLWIDVDGNQVGHAEYYGSKRETMKFAAMGFSQSS